jgi:hypothetical protein
VKTLGEQVCDFAEEHLEVELTDWQRAQMQALYRPGDPGALART